MATELDDLRVLKAAEEIADSVWKKVVTWDEFAKDVVGKQMTRAIDSIGANLAESFGHFNYGEKLQFLYYARGSLFEAKYWLNRALIRGLVEAEEINAYTARLSEVARQLNTFASSLKSQRKDSKALSKSIYEPGAEYIVTDETATDMLLFTETELNWLAA